MKSQKIEHLFMEDGIFRGVAIFADGTEFSFDKTREEIVRYMTDIRKSRFAYEDDGKTILPDRKLLANFLKQAERIHNNEVKKAQPSKRGGFREGSGRKLKDGIATQTITVRIRIDLLEAISACYEGTRSDFIQSAIKEKLRRDGLL